MLEEDCNRCLAPRITHIFFSGCGFRRPLFRPVGEIVNHRREFPGEQEIPEVVEEMKSRINKCVLVVDDALKSKDFILGKEFTAADVSLGYSLMGARNKLDNDFPKRVSEYWESISSRGFSRSSEKK